MGRYATTFGCMRPGCREKHYAKGLCEKHWRRQRKAQLRGDFLVPRREAGEHGAKVIIQPIVWRLLQEISKRAPRGHYEWKDSIQQRLSTLHYDWACWKLREAQTLGDHIEPWMREAVIQAWSVSPPELRERALKYRMAKVPASAAGAEVKPMAEEEDTEISEEEREKRCRSFWVDGRYPWESGLQPCSTGGYSERLDAPGTWGHQYPRACVAKQGGSELAPGVATMLPYLAYLQLVGVERADWASIPQSKWQELGKPSELKPSEPENPVIDVESAD